MKETIVPMKLVYQLSEELKKDPEQVSLAQALTLDAARPLLGLKGVFGLFGSKEWWMSIENGTMQTSRVTGVISRTYVAGQDKGDQANTFDMVLSDGSKLMEGMYVNKKAHRDLYRIGSRVDIFYALDPLKTQTSPADHFNYSEIVVEMAVSLQSIE